MTFDDNILYRHPKIAVFFESIKEEKRGKALQARISALEGTEFHLEEPMGEAYRYINLKGAKLMGSNCPGLISPPIQVRWA